MEYFCQGLFSIKHLRFSAASVPPPGANESQNGSSFPPVATWEKVESSSELYEIKVQKNIYLKGNLYLKKNK